MNYLIYGKRKQGKSTLALALAASEHKSIIVFDPNDQFPLISSVEVDTIPSWLERRTDGFRLVRVGPFESAEIPKRFAEFSSCLWDAHDISIVADEAHLLQGAGWLDENLDRWNRRSAGDVAFIQTTHRIVDAHPDSRYHADHVFFFYAYLARELKTLRDNFGDVAEYVPLLKPFQVIHWHKEAGGVPHYAVWPDGHEWYIDLENSNDE